MRELNDSAKEILLSYQERYFNKFFDEFIGSTARQDDEFDYEKSMFAFSILEGVVDCKNKEYFDNILDDVFCEFGEKFFSEHQSYLCALFNRCHTDNFEEEFPEEVTEMIGHCVRVSSMTDDEVNESAAEYFRVESKKYLEHKKHFLMAGDKVLRMCGSDALEPSAVRVGGEVLMDVANSNIPNTIFEPSVASAFTVHKSATKIS